MQSHSQLSRPNLFVYSDDSLFQPDAWIAPFQKYFDPNQIQVVLITTDGRPASALPATNHWKSLEARLTANDIVLLLPGGVSTTELRSQLQDVLTKDAKPVVAIRPIFDSQFGNTAPASDSEWFRSAVGDDRRVGFVDIAELMRFKLQCSLRSNSGHPAASARFAAELIAECILAALKSLLNAPVSRYLSDAGRQVIPATELYFREPAIRDAPTLWIIGDSTVRNGDGLGLRGIWGWGDHLNAHFDITAINLVNRAVSGRSSRTYYTMEWPGLLSTIKPGDYLLLQFGHNDEGDPADRERARAPLPGLGCETITIANPITGLEEIVHTFGWYLRKIIGEAMEAGITPIVCSLVPQMQWEGSRIRREVFADWSREIAYQEGVTFIDLTSLLAECYEKLGTLKVADLFAEPPAHTNLEGAKLTAQIVASEMRRLGVLNQVLKVPGPQNQSVTPVVEVNLVRSGRIRQIGKRETRFPDL